MSSQNISYTKSIRGLESTMEKVERRNDYLLHLIWGQSYKTNLLGRKNLENIGIPTKDFLSLIFIL